MAPDDAGRRARLRSMKLAALVADHVGCRPGGEPAPFAPGAAIADDDHAWISLEDAPERALGAALAWAHRRSVSSIDLIADHGTGTLARRAGAFAVDVRVWRAEGRALVPAVAAPLPVAPSPSPAHLALVPAIEAGGATPVVEHGVVTGEVRGLEVCRVVDDPITGAVRLEVGVGIHDREAFALLHGDVPDREALAGVVASVDVHRRPGAAPHPLNRLAGERFLRWRLIADPATIGLVELVAAEPPMPRGSVGDPVPCVARGRNADGTPVVVVCSVGVDLDVVPAAVDARLAAAGGGPLPATTVVVPERDLLPITAEIAALLTDPVAVVAAPTG